MRFAIGKIGIFSPISGKKPKTLSLREGSPPSPGGRWPPGAGRGAAPGPTLHRPTPVRAPPCHPLPGEGSQPSPGGRWPPGAGRGAAPGPTLHRPTPVTPTACHPLPGEGSQPPPTGKAFEGSHQLRTPRPSPSPPGPGGSCRRGSWSGSEERRTRPPGRGRTEPGAPG